MGYTWFKNDGNNNNNNKERKKEKRKLFKIFFNYQLNRGHLNRSVDIRYSIVAFKYEPVNSQVAVGITIQKRLN